VYIRGVSTIELDAETCNGCLMCIKVCPHAVFGRADGAVEIIEADACMECGACVLNCTERALSVNPGVGCALAILTGWIRRSEPTCRC
jgi:ferredoxin